MVPCEVPAHAASECHLLTAETPLCCTRSPVSPQDGGQRRAHSAPHRHSAGMGGRPPAAADSPLPASTSIQGGARGTRAPPGGDCQALPAPLPCGCPCAEWGFPWALPALALALPQSTFSPTECGSPPGGRPNAGFGEGLGLTCATSGCWGCVRSPPVSPGGPGGVGSGGSGLQGGARCQAAQGAGRACRGACPTQHGSCWGLS